MPCARFVLKALLHASWSLAPSPLGRRVRVVAVGAAMLVAARVGTSAQARQANVPDIIRTLDLSERGAPRWLGLLTNGLDQAGQERVLAVDRAGKIVDSVLGDASQVSLPLAFQAKLQQAGSDLVLVHNHANDRGLSADDLSHLAKPGIAAVAAIGHRGSVYVAGATPRYERRVFVDRQYALARAHVLRQLGLKQSSHSVGPEVGAEHLAHVICLVLAKMGVIEYRAALASERRASFERNRVVLLEVILSAAGRLRP